MSTPAERLTAEIRGVGVPDGWTKDIVQVILPAIEKLCREFAADELQGAAGRLDAAEVALGGVNYVAYELCQRAATLRGKEE